ncbi:hypothetical protein [Altererythrobacter sp. TH136]|uniref:DUF4139 domain-containing protein n=1 Tax=Altererythrobacter sp. TH136 TaxID=2067415 RepID=UPI00116453E4|nr:hypothetical protein [Altererythrobacter sp. TH136]QDM40311.1 hypothetical protein C0V74_04030 [Altererythrobacter sp. TH136]
MRRAVLLLLLAGAGSPGEARETVDASAPRAISVTMYRDPDRAPDQKLDRNWPRGFAMISETRRVVLPPGESTIRFDGVAEGMVAVSAIVTGLPGGTIEKNRNADLLSPGALVDGSLGNRVTITRTNPASGLATSEEAIVRTRADGGLVLQTSAGFEAVRCSGLAENVTFDRVPPGLSANPVYTIDTASPRGGTFDVTLTYLAWGFDWQANYVATVAGGASPDKLSMHLTSWLTLVNDNGQSFPDAELLAVAGRLSVVSNYRELADPPDAKPLRLLCYPLGSTAAGSPVEVPPPYPFAPPPPPPPAPMAAIAQDIIVTGSRARAPALVAREENLADLKLYRVPEPVTVTAKSQKQIAFLDRDQVTGRMIYTTECAPWTAPEGARAASIILATVNDTQHGLGVALPAGSLTVFEQSARGDQLIGRPTIRDYAAGQEVEIGLGQSTQVFVTCSAAGRDPAGDAGTGATMRAVLSNATPKPVTVRMSLGRAGAARITGLKGVRVKDGQQIADVIVPGNGNRRIEWRSISE